jgi:hypothetical protein
MPVAVPTPFPSVVKGALPIGPNRDTATEVLIEKVLKPRHEDGALLTVSQIGRRMETSADAVNLLLSAIGLQCVSLSPAGLVTYVLTPEGITAGGVSQDNKESDVSGQPVRQLLWDASVITILEGDDLPRAA